MARSTRETPFVFAVLVMLLGVVLYDVMGAIVKHLGQTYTAPQLSLYRNLFGLVPTLAILYWSRQWVRSRRSIVIRQWKLALARGGIGAIAQICFYFALARVEFATATTIVFANPLFVTALSVPVLGLAVGWPRWAAVVIGFVGVVLVMQPSANSFDWSLILPLCAAFGYAVNSITSRLFDEDIPTAVVNLYYSVGTLAGTLALIFFTGSFVPVQSTADWTWIATMGIAGGLAGYLWVSAFRMGEPGSLSPFQYFAIPSSFLMGWIFFGETPFDALFPGALLIVAGRLIIIWRERRLKKAGT